MDHIRGIGCYLLAETLASSGKFASFPLPLVRKSINYQMDCFFLAPMAEFTVNKPGIHFLFDFSFALFLRGLGRHRRFPHVFLDSFLHIDFILFVAKSGEIILLMFCTEYR